MEEFWNVTTSFSICSSVFNDGLHTASLDFFYPIRFHTCIVFTEFHMSSFASPSTPFRWIPFDIHVHSSIYDCVWIMCIALLSPRFLRTPQKFTHIVCVRFIHFLRVFVDLFMYMDFAFSYLSHLI